ncbi:excisionase family DNA binding protein [Streptomyces sp. TLI_235]|nr:helix-turn-helix domain-containing protein [Streptomyces sp. TLI_235]PBC80127.1 excisionase family DNA binding protein [Streptomyces sp. TLI_235]
MSPKFPNPPLEQIRPEHLLTTEQAAAHLGVKKVTIRRWVHDGKIEAVPLGDTGPRLYHLVPLAQAEKDAWDHGAHRPIRGGRRPGWSPSSNATPAAA